MAKITKNGIWDRLQEKYLLGNIGVKSQDLTRRIYANKKDYIAIDFKQKIAFSFFKIFLPSKFTLKLNFET